MEKNALAMLGFKKGLRMVKLSVEIGTEGRGVEGL